MNVVPSKRIDRKKLETQKKIIATAVSLFNQYGLDNVTMEQIAASTDISKGTLYNYFPSKEAVINAFLQNSFQDNNRERLAALRKIPDTRGRVEWVLTLLVEGVARQKDVFEVFMVYRMKNILSFKPIEESQQTGLSLLIHEILSLGREQGDLRTDLPETILEGLFEFALIEAIKPMYLEPAAFDQKLSIQQAADVFLNGAKA